MGSSETAANNIVVDPIHGDIHLTDEELAVIDTVPFQRLRHIKQLGMGQVTYPAATHTRFAHSLGTLAIMQRVVASEGFPFELKEEDKANLQLAALLHDIGHYPYSHLMEKIDEVTLTEDQVRGDGPAKTVDVSASPYPKHEPLGRLIVTQQKEICDALGGHERATQVADLFTREGAENSQLSKLINSSFDLDRLDFLLRDAHFAGVPYGRIDINYLLNSLKVSPTGMLGFTQKALSAAEHFLFARFFMHRNVYYHKTTFGLEEACRQLLRRLRDTGKVDMPKDGKAVEDLVQSDGLGTFTDAYVDYRVQEAANLPSTSENEVIRALARAIQSRRPPKLLKEVAVLCKGAEEEVIHGGTLLQNNCQHRLSDLAEKHGIPLGQFLLCQTKPLKLESRGKLLTEDQARALGDEEEDDLVKVFLGNDAEPQSLVNAPDGLISLCADHYFQAFRLYVVYEGEDRDSKLADMAQEVAAWDQP